MDKDSPFVYSGAHWSKGDPKEIAIKFIPSKSKVLDVGCGSGSLGLWLRKNNSCSVDGVDGHPEAVKEASKHLNNAKCVDLNDLNAVKDFVNNKAYDRITFIDVLEHCHHPKKLLEIFKETLAPEGRIIISLPNIAHYSARLRILKGNFDYDDSGLFDKTHVKFYTRKTSANLIESAGLKIEKTLNTSPQKGLSKLVSQIDPTLTAIQFIMIAKR
jgi:methionine biosynthesis protein MetW